MLLETLTFFSCFSFVDWFFVWKSKVTCFLFNREEKQEEAELPKYRDRAKERREDQNPDYEPTELGSFHAVAPPGAVDLR